MSGSSTTIHGSRSLLVFVAAQALLATACTAAWFIYPTEDRSLGQPVLLNEPVQVNPQYNVPDVVTDEQLSRVLGKLRPRFKQMQPKINHVDHALRCWGADVEFEDPRCISGNEMRRLLADHQAFQAAWGVKTRPLLLAKDHGVAVRTQQGDASASHVDHTLATLAECGTPLDFPIRLAGGSATMRDVLSQALATFDINQHEYEWTVLALALYARDGQPWFSAEGDRMDFNRLVHRVIRQRYGQGVCYGNHRLYSLTLLLRLNRDKQLLSQAVRQELIDHLAEATRRLAANQHADGYWDRNWHDLKVPANDEDMALGGPLSRRILATGHALEWWAMVPQEHQSELLPDQAVIVKAAHWLVSEIEKMDEKAIDANYTFLSHAGRALALWRGTVPALVAIPGRQSPITSGASESPKQFIEEQP